MSQANKYSEFYSTRFMELTLADSVREAFIELGFFDLGLPGSFVDECSQILERIGSGNLQTVVCGPAHLTSGYKDSESRKDLLLTFSSCCTRVQRLLDSVVDACYCTVFRLPSPTSQRNFFQRYLLFSIVDRLEEIFKFHSGYLVAKLCPPTEPPKLINIYEGVPGVILGGWVRRLFDSKNIPVQKKLKLALSLQNAKRGAAAVSIRKRLIAVKEHMELLSKKPVPKEGLPSRFSIKDEKIMAEIKSSIHKLVKRYYTKKDDDKGTFEVPEWRTPSLQAGTCPDIYKGNWNSIGGIAQTLENISREQQPELWEQRTVKLFRGKTETYWNYIGPSQIHGYIRCNNLELPIYGPSPFFNKRSHGYPLREGF
jgi:hypothetical protein